MILIVIMAPTVGSLGFEQDLMIGGLALLGCLSAHSGSATPVGQERSASVESLH